MSFYEIDRPKGYYVANVLGCADGDVIVYFDGKEYWSHGNAEPVPADEDFGYVSAGPINLKDLWKGVQNES